MKIAAATYPLDWLNSWEEYERKITSWIGEAAGAGADLLIFPEYGSMELASLAGEEVAADLEASITAVVERADDMNALFARLAAEHGVHVLAPSVPALTEGRPVNRAHFFAPDGRTGTQAKQIMTRFEREDWDIAPGRNGLKLFDTSLGKIGILICYDSEFPLLGRALKDADLILVPSATERLTGYSRVRIGSMARAMENQCVVAMSSVIGDVPWLPAIEAGVGRGGIFGPPDTGFPPTGVIAEGEMNVPGWVYADVDLGLVEAVRADGVTLHRRHWDEQDDVATEVTSVVMR
ncbi:carbon-nitrogen hydrolase family protein [Chachezhania sediminis]|uniref:carbon-nitrogen hydrolase family protein n=1 Tax=Chachezhania sediminis TaxID=2599291 RepID=UPI00131B4ABE|nr:carbon-nitrogen hydrolase family protein [Chachezhania sediminis]